jgi:hypothetical protein
MLGSIQTEKCIRLGAKENSKICKSYKKLGNWETLVQRRKIARICALHKIYSGEPAWKVVGDRL